VVGFFVFFCFSFVVIVFGVSNDYFLTALFVVVVFFPCGTLLFQGQKFTSKAFRVIKTAEEGEEKADSSSGGAAAGGGERGPVSPTSARMKRMAKLKKLKSSRKN
jgi:hypothetical protein